MREAPWQKSSFSAPGGNGDCVEVTALAPGTLHLRESNHPETAITFTPAALRSLLSQARSGRLDRELDFGRPSRWRSGGQRTAPSACHPPL
ncbi:DUF397 domain-containing protein [Streptomyces sp. I05A-00742]|uniref:DUF397 domain-containing protein n=1 Tax=Streptomyces sp. I05A-00742 TaxID=2732853 RepID=UPI001488D9D9|nr:DUF397 domain-containing protein [Streptomyces sp. I05A-00742]